MTMQEVQMRTMAAGKFKAQCLAVMDEVQARREPVLVTKHGKPVAKMVPLEIAEEEDPLDRYHFGTIEIVGDITTPIYSDEEWEEFCEASVTQYK